MLRRRQRKPQPTTSSRAGTATVELAVCLPVLALLVFGGIQACDLIYLKHSLTAAAYEGTLEVNKSSAANADVEARIQQVLDARGVTGTTAKILPAGTQIDQSPPGTTITISVEADTSPNLLLSSFFFTPAKCRAKWSLPVKT